MSNPAQHDLYRTIKALESVEMHAHDPELRTLARQKLAYLMMTVMVDWEPSREVLAGTSKDFIKDMLMVALEEVRTLRRLARGNGLRYPGTDEVFNHE